MDFSAWFIFLCFQVRSSARCLCVGCFGQWFGRLLSFLTFCRGNQQKQMLSQLLNKAFSFVTRTIFLLPLLLFATHVHGNIKRIPILRTRKISSIIYWDKTTKACQELKQFTNGMAIVPFISIETENRTFIAITITRKTNGTIFVFNLEIFNFTWQFFIHFSKYFVDTYLMFI